MGTAARIAGAAKAEFSGLVSKAQLTGMPYWAVGSSKRTIPLHVDIDRQSWPAKLTMNSRELILSDIRAQHPDPTPLPPLDYSWTRYEDETAQFLDVLRNVGGAGYVVSTGEASQLVAGLLTELDARYIYSAAPEIWRGNVDLAANDPHELADVELAILPGELAVAENAAVWVTGRVAPQRVVYFLSQHVVLAVPADRVVHNMHEAYDWLHREAAPGRPFETAKWGTFMSGPSKTADIEQALVIGAHGARSLHVLLIVDDPVVD